MFLQQLLDYVNSLKVGNTTNIGQSIELEVKILLDPRIKTPTYIKANTAPNINTAIETIKTIISNARVYGMSNISQTINFIYTDNEKMFVKQLYFTNGVQDKEKKQYYIKKSLIQPIFLVSNDSNIPSYKLSVNTEIVQENDIEQFDIVRFRLRYSIDFNINDLKDWKLDLTLIKEIRNPSMEQIKKTKDKLFTYTEPITANNFLENVDWLYADRIELELEYVGDIASINIKHISQLDKLWKILYIKTVEKTYSDCICQIAQIIKPKNLDKFQSGYFGLKQLGNNPVELTKRSYNKKVLSNIDNFILTEKIDGMRSMLIIYPKKGECHIINKQYRYMNIPVNPNETDDLIILDTEEYIQEEKLYYVFDCVWYNKNTSNLVFCDNKNEDRMEYIERAISKYDFLKSKHFIYLNQSNYAIQIQQFADLILPNETMETTFRPATDGFIFISKNANYNHTNNYKWKPVEMMTIDFVVKKCPQKLLGISPYDTKENKTLYLLFSGIRNVEYKKLGINKLKEYDTIFKKVQYRDSYFPIQFSPSSNPHAYLFWCENPDLDDNIIELSKVDNEWQLFKIRNDRKVDMERKTYYGNYFKVAEYIWMNYNNPLTLKNLYMPESPEYFQEDDNEQYKYIRKFNNYVKNELTQMYSGVEKNIEWVIDLASGKGQDLFKYIEYNIKNILMVENDHMALMEIINRKYAHINKKEENKKESHTGEQMKSQTNKKTNNMSKIFIKQLDLTDSYKKNLLSIQESKFGLPSDGVPLVICNFALHYLVPNKRKIQNFCGLLHKLLAPGGIFIFTAFDGRKIFNLFEADSDTWERRVDDQLLYSIKKKYTGAEFTGNNQQIDVLLPFSNGQYYTEYLIDVALLKQELEKKKITLVNENSFGTCLDEFKHTKPHFYKSLTDIDKEFVSLYHFYVFQKSVGRCRKGKKIN